MSMGQVKGRRSFCGKMLLGLACIVAGTIAALSGAAFARAMGAQAATPAAAQPSPKDLTGAWQGTLHAGHDLRTVLKIAKDDKGAYKAQFFSIDQGGQPIPVDSVALDGSTMTFAIKMIGGNFEGKMSADGKTIDGTWTQGPNPLPLTLTRTPEDAAWAIPAPPQQMAADANPSFDVATIKPSVPGRRGKGFGFRGREFMTINTNLNDLIAFAYGLHAKQIDNAPAWSGTDLYDIVGVPDVPGRPSLKQMGGMVQKLLADRFQLKFHYEQRVLSVYAVTVAAAGPKMTKSSAAPSDQQGFGFRALGDLSVRNMTMANFASWMQSGVMDRPVVDQTGLTDRYDFQLKWTPDDSQFAQFRGTGVVVPPPTDAANAPPSLYTAVQEQLGLKIEATKAPDTVMVIDHVDHPSPN